MPGSIFHRPVAAGPAFSAPRINVVSNLNRQLASAELADPGYWVSTPVKAVRVRRGIGHLTELGVNPGFSGTGPGRGR